MKRTLALLLVAIMAITCTVAALTVSAETVYTDKVNLMPTNVKNIRDNQGGPGFALENGKLALSRTAESTVAWPSIIYDVNAEVDLTATPYLHMSFETSGVGDRGVNGHLLLKDASGNELDLQISAIGGNGVDDFRDTDEIYPNLVDYIGEYLKAEGNEDLTFDVSGKVTVTGVILSVYGGVGETIYWNTLALAKEGADEEDNTTSDEGDTTTSAEGETTTSVEDNTTSDAPAETTSAPAESDKVPTGDAGILLFAVLGVVALAGVAVAVKARH